MGFQRVHAEKGPPVVGWRRDGASQQPGTPWSVSESCQGLPGSLARPLLSVESRSHYSSLGSNCRTQMPSWVMSHEINQETCCFSGQLKLPSPPCKHSSIYRLSEGQRTSQPYPPGLWIQREINTQVHACTWAWMRVPRSHSASACGSKQAAPKFWPLPPLTGTAKSQTSFLPPGQTSERLGLCHCRDKSLFFPGLSYCICN